MHSSRTFLFTALLGAGLLIAGCQHAGNSPAGRANAPAGPAPDETAISSAVDRTHVVAQGVNQELAFKAPGFGNLYLYDADTGAFVYQGHLAAGEKFVFEPASSRAQIDKQTVDLRRVTNEHDEYRLYFAPR